MSFELCSPNPDSTENSEEPGKLLHRSGVFRPLRLFNQPSIAAHSTIDSFSDVDLHAASRSDGLRYEVETVSLNDLLAFWNAPRRIDYLSIDTEGSELDILQHFDFAAYDVRLITVEHNHTAQRPLIHDLLTAKGFRRKFESLSNVDDWYVRSDQT